MEGNDKLKEIDIKNCMHYSFSNIIKIEIFNWNWKIIRKYFGLWHLTGAKPWRIRFDQVYEFIRVYDGTRYLVLFGHEKLYNLQ